VGFGVSRSRLSATGKGSTQPIIRFEDRDNWWKNRRVEFILIK
jgi:outer membrane protein OmpA-like peptidoglycan-associated protein